ncbi:hypothetical protein RFI_22890 [Reticulomyxa filosa]|uniref:Uncharacterized protein n=1 Tax=Reticulomyxa filosa TaxID=46433 RepID=X6MN20_RETFI|nr:hypothetical protein RFI_22890 [Reticulomyxa filosa]|eukprot:ETO14480.1 hypothetical protein RFI_22890 [Reticulomyxa filosa]
MCVATIAENIIVNGLKSLYWIWASHFILFSSFLYLLLSMIATVKVFRYIGDWNPSNDGTTSIPMPTSQEVGIRFLSWSIRALISFVVSGQIVVCSFLLTKKKFLSVFFFIKKKKKKSKEIVNFFKNIKIIITKKYRKCVSCVVIGREHFVYF